MTAVGCGIVEVNPPQHSIKQREKCGLDWGRRLNLELGNVWFRKGPLRFRRAFRAKPPDFWSASGASRACDACRAEGASTTLDVVLSVQRHRTLATGPIIGSRLGRDRQQLSGVRRWRRYFNGHLSRAELGQCEGNNLLILFQCSFAALNRS
jgi:hypothetical protein